MFEIVQFSATRGGLYYHEKINRAIFDGDDQAAAACMQLHLYETIKPMGQWDGGFTTLFD